MIRPLVALLVILVLSSYAIESNASWEDAIEDNHVDAYTKKVSQFLDVADEVVLYGHSYQDFSPGAKEPRLQCVCKAYHNAIMIDYDTMRIAFLLQGSVDRFYVYNLEAGALTGENSYIQSNSLLPDSETRLITYYPNEDSYHRTCAIELILSDGTVYSTTETPDENWEDAFLDLALTSDKTLFRVGAPHPGYEDDDE